MENLGGIIGHLFFITPFITPLIFITPGWYLSDGMEWNDNLDTAIKKLKDLFSIRMDDSWDASAGSASSEG